MKFVIFIILFALAGSTMSQGLPGRVIVQIENLFGSVEGVARVLPSLFAVTRSLRAFNKQMEIMARRIPDGPISALSSLANILTQNSNGGFDNLFKRCEELAAALKKITNTSPLSVNILKLAETDNALRNFATAYDGVTLSFRSAIREIPNWSFEHPFVGSVAPVTTSVDNVTKAKKNILAIIKEMRGATGAAFELAAKTAELPEEFEGETFDLHEVALPISSYQNALPSSGLGDLSHAMSQLAIVVRNIASAFRNEPL